MRIIDCVDRFQSLLRSVNQPQTQPTISWVSRCNCSYRSNPTFSFLFGPKSLKEAFSVPLKPGIPRLFLVRSPSIKINAFSIVCLCVFTRCNHAQIFDPVIRPIAINVVYHHSLRNKTEVHFPDNPMHIFWLPFALPLEINHQISMGGFRSGFLTNSNTIAWSDFPIQESVRVLKKIMPKNFFGHIAGSQNRQRLPIPSYSNPRTVWFLCVAYISNLKASKETAIS